MEHNIPMLRSMSYTQNVRVNEMVQLVNGSDEISLHESVRAETYMAKAPTSYGWIEMSGLSFRNRCSYQNFLIHVDSGFEKSTMEAWWGYSRTFISVNCVAAMVLT